MTHAVCPNCQASLPETRDAFCPECHEPLLAENTSNELPSSARQTEPQAVATHSDPATTALEMVRTGATPGMVRRYLRSEGLSDADCDSIIDRSMRESSTQARIKGIWWIVGGAATLLLGIGITWNRYQNTGTPGRMPLGIIIAGTVMLGKGVVAAVSGIDDD